MHQNSGQPQILRQLLTEPKSPFSGLAMVRGRWLITFGDLLTLLLCFFLCSLSLSAAKPKQVVESNENSVGSPDSLRQPIRLQADGTTLAESKVSSSALKSSSESGQELLKPLEYLASDYTVDSGQLVDNAAKRLVEQVNQLNRSVLKGVQIQSCAESDSGSSRTQFGDIWMLATARALELRRQLVGAGIDPKIVRLQLLGSECGVIRTLDSSQIVTRLNFKLEQ